MELPHLPRSYASLYEAYAGGEVGKYADFDHAVIRHQQLGGLFAHWDWDKSISGSRLSLISGYYRIVLQTCCSRHLLNGHPTFHTGWFLFFLCEACGRGLTGQYYFHFNLHIVG